MKQEEKTDQILEAATRRFAHFGVDKTTMNEIADDLGISKASLYYYFPDKLNLYAAALKKIIDAEQGSETPFLNEKDLHTGMMQYLEHRTDFIIRNYKVLEYLRNVAGMIPDELRTLFDEARHRDVYVLSAFLKKGINEGLLDIADLPSAAHLMHDSLAGLRLNEFSQKNFFFPEAESFKDLLNREKQLVHVFLKAYKK